MRSSQVLESVLYIGVPSVMCNTCLKWIKLTNLKGKKVKGYILYSCPNCNTVLLRREVTW